MRQAAGSCQLLPIAKFSEIRDEWNSTWQRLGAHPLLSLDFVEPLIEIFAAPDWRIARITAGGTTRAIAILHRAGWLRWEVARPPNAPLGLWLGDRRLPWSAALRLIRSALPGFPLLVSVLGIDPEMTDRPAATATLKAVDDRAIPALTLEAPFETWLARCSGNLRRNLRRQMRRLKDQGSRYEFSSINRPGAMAVGIDEFADLESAGWKADAGSAVGRGSAQARFYSRVFERFAARNAATIWRLVIDGQLAASDLVIRGPSMHVVLKTAYRESLGESGLSPGELLRLHEFAAICASEQSKHIEFYGRSMAWHRRWAIRERSLYHVNSYRCPLLGELHARSIAIRGASRPRE